MPVAEIIRAWKDEDYLLTLSDEEMRALPENPAGDPRFHLGLESRQESEETAFITIFKFCHSIVIECSASNCG